MIRAGEESQEDSLKIRSVENFPEAWLWNLICFLFDFRFSCESEFRKLLNSKTWQTGWTTKIMCWRWNFNQTLKKWTWLHMMIFSCRIMKKHVSIDSEMSFMRFGWKCVFAIFGEWVSLMEFDERKNFEVLWKYTLSWENKWKWMIS